MPVQKFHFVTGRLAEKALQQVARQASQDLEFEFTIQVMPISVAALMTPHWVAKHLEIPAGTTKVIVPGYCDDLAPLQNQFQVEFQTGPKRFASTGGVSRRQILEA